MAILSYFPAGEAPATLPEFTFTGNYELLDDGDGNWRIKCKTSGTLTFTDKNHTLDVFMVGGGGGAPYGGGAGGGYTRLVPNVVISKNVQYTVTIGAGGYTINTESATDGGNTSFGALSAAGGGRKGTEMGGGSGGSGGGGRANGTGGSNGSNGGAGGEAGGGTGQGTTTREFHEASGSLYSRGGGAVLGANGAGLTGANSGAGGKYSDSSGGSGIVIVRNNRAV